MKQEKSMRDSAASKDGATTGSLGDASQADLDKGFTKEPASSQAQHTPVLTSAGGFLYRPGGWER